MQPIESAPQHRMITNHVIAFHRKIPPGIAIQNNSRTIFTFVGNTLQQKPLYLIFIVFSIKYHQIYTTLCGYLMQILVFQAGQ